MANDVLRIEMAFATLALARAKQLSVERDGCFFAVSTGPVSFAVTDEPTDRDTIIGGFDCGYAFSDPSWELRGFWADE
jgi:hypothetical protein